MVRESRGLRRAGACPRRCHRRRALSHSPHMHGPLRHPHSLTVYLILDAYERLASCRCASAVASVRQAAARSRGLGAAAADLCASRLHRGFTEPAANAREGFTVAARADMTPATQLIATDQAHSEHKKWKMDTRRSDLRRCSAPRPAQEPGPLQEAARRTVDHCNARIDPLGTRCA